MEKEVFFLKIFLFIITLVILTTQIKNIFNFKTIKRSIDEDINICKNKELATNICIISAIVMFIYFSLCGIYINTFIFSIICFIYCLWTLFDMSNMRIYLKVNKVTRTLNSKPYKIISKPFDIAFSLYIIYFIAIHW